MQTGHKRCCCLRWRSQAASDVCRTVQTGWKARPAAKTGFALGGFQTPPPAAAERIRAIAIPARNVLSAICQGGQYSWKAKPPANTAFAFCGRRQLHASSMAGTDLCDGAVRLAQGNSLNEGRVEIYYNGQWGTVCDDDWDIMDAHVVCRSLGFMNAIEAKQGAAYGEGLGPILLDDVACDGTEKSLVECRSQGWLSNNCGHGEDAGVVCDSKIAFNPGVFFLDHSGGFPEDLGKLYDSQQDCDLNITVLIADNNTEALSLCAHRLILRTNSEASLLLQGSTLKVDEACLPNVNSFLRYFYSRQIRVTVHSVKCFHKLALAYGVSSLQAYCIQVFPNFFPLDPTFHAQLKLYNYSLASGDAQLQDLIMQYLAWNCEVLTRTEAWLALTPEMMEALLSRTDVVIQNEWSLLKALDQWAHTNEIKEGHVEKIRFPMLLPEQLLELQFNLTFYETYKNIFQMKIMEALEFHTVPLRFLEQYKLHDLTSDSHTPRFYIEPTWSIHQYFSGFQVPQLLETIKHPSFLFKMQKITWNFTYHGLAQSHQSGRCSSSVITPVSYLTLEDSSDDTIHYNNKALLICQSSYITGIVSFQNGTALFPNATFFPCPIGFSNFIAVVRPSYKLNT
ncbi:galectin-3-binding protein [Lacerta agilis]|uniref:galectin-3-binding protein n=1 Tax=Lacerta agilis TaxID=80427 RepID=UPI0014196E37|nr:galectin-3-binding protein [Lacerta agilis]